MPKQRNRRAQPTRTPGSHPGVLLYAPRSAPDCRPRNAREVAESVDQMIKSPRVERTAVTEASVGGATATKPGRMLVRLITAGISKNGNAYPAHVLEAAARSRAWGKGCKAYIDHATPEEEEAHPSGSVRALAAVLTEDARWDPASQSLVAEVRLFEPWRGPLTEMAEADAIGMSIRAWVSGGPGEYQGQECFLVERIEVGRSCDFVTDPAAGGGIISVLEAVGNPVPTAEAANLGAWLESRLHLTLTQYADDMYGDGQLTRDERIALSGAIGDGLQAWTARIETDAPQLFQRDRWSSAPEPEQAAVVAAESATAEPPQDPPAQTPPAEPAPTPEVTPDVTDGTPPSVPATPSDPEEEPVSGIQTGAPPEQAGIATVPDSETTPAQPSAEALQALLAEAMRPLTEQIAAFQAREGQRDAEARTLRHRQQAAEAVTTALQNTDHADVVASISSRVNSRVLADVPTTAEGAVDDARLGEVIATVIADEATHVRRERANALAEAGVGLPFGVGAAPAQESNDDGLEGVLENFYSGALGMTSEAAKIAGKGR